MWDIIMVVASIWIGARLGRWLVLEQVKEILSRIARANNTTVEYLLSTAMQPPIPQSPSKPAENRYQIQQVNGCYYAWGPGGFAAQATTAAELITKLKTLDQHCEIDAGELNITQAELEELTR